MTESAEKQNESLEGTTETFSLPALKGKDRIKVTKSQKSTLDDLVMPSNTSRMIESATEERVHNEMIEALMRMTEDKRRKYASARYALSKLADRFRTHLELYNDYFITCKMPTEAGELESSDENKSNNIHILNELRREIDAGIAEVESNEEIKNIERVEKHTKALIGKKNLKSRFLCMKERYLSYAGLLRNAIDLRLKRMHELEKVDKDLAKAYLLLYLDNLTSSEFITAGENVKKGGYRVGEAIRELVNLESRFYERLLDNFMKVEQDSPKEEKKETLNLQSRVTQGRKRVVYGSVPSSRPIPKKEHAYRPSLTPYQELEAAVYRKKDDDNYSTVSPAVNVFLKYAARLNDEQQTYLAEEFKRFSLDKRMGWKPLSKQAAKGFFNELIVKFNENGKLPNLNKLYVEYLREDKK